MIGHANIPTHRATATRCAALRPPSRRAVRVVARTDPAELVAKEYDAVIIGSGPVGCTFARKLVDAGKTVLVVDAGPRTGPKPGSHLKNAFKYQRDVNSFAHHIRGALHTLSVPSDLRAVPTLDPLAFNPEPRADGFIRGNQNPLQRESDNLPAAAATYGVGGKATHWTCSCPRPRLDERSWQLPADASYAEAERLLRVNQETFLKHSVRDRVLNKVLGKAYKERGGALGEVRSGEKYVDGPQPLPLAARRLTPECVSWTGADVILGEELLNLEATGASNAKGGSLTLLDNHICKQLKLSSSQDTVEGVVLLDGLAGVKRHVTAGTVIVAAGTVLTSQIVWHSLNKASIKPSEMLPALGRYLTEQPMAFCQVIWRGDIIASEFEPLCPASHDLSLDPVPIPINDPDPNHWIPVSPGRPWHAQIHRDAFAYGDFGPNVDSRLIVDLRFFGIIGQRQENYVEFASCAKRGITDIFGLPQPTFHYSYTTEEKLLMHAMMDDMLYYAGKIGGFLPGSEPQFMKPGLSLHIHGCTRVGESRQTSVVSRFGKVHGMKNLYLGGNGVIPTAIACNPTLTSVAYAIDAANYITRA